MSSLPGPGVQNKKKKKKRLREVVWRPHESYFSKFELWPNTKWEIVTVSVAHVIISLFL